MARTKNGPTPVAKAPTGIPGLDEITLGGLPRGRPTLICGTAGCGKTLMGMEFLVRGAVEFGEPGVFLAFEETAEELAKNVASLGFDLDRLSRQNKLHVDHVRVERSEIEETGEYNLDGLFVRLNYEIDSIGAKRVVLDTIESLFSGLSNHAILRAELRRLFRWLKDKHVTAVITGESGDKTLTRYGLEEYVADCVIVLDHRVNDQISTRRLRIVKYRGSLHGTNEYPYLIGEKGIEVLPITSVGLNHVASKERISTGIPALDNMLGGKGYYRGASILVSGTAGTGKTTLAAHFVDAACARGERCLFLAFEESPSQIQRNMRSVGIDLERWVDKGLLKFHSVRPSVYGLELHLATMHKWINEFDPSIVVVDPITNLTNVGSGPEIRSMLTRLMDFLKSNQITSLYTALTYAETGSEMTDIGISSIMDTWLRLRDFETNGERNRGLYVSKSRGMPHSNQVREFLLTDRGIELHDVYSGPEGMLMGSARAAQEAREEGADLVRRQQIDKTHRDLARKREEMEAQVASLRGGYKREAQEARELLKQQEERETTIAEDRVRMTQLRTRNRNKPNGYGTGKRKGIK